MVEEKVERIYTVPLGKAYDHVRTRRTPKAVKLLRQFVSRHMKTELDNVLLSNKVNSYLWEHSIQRPPRRVKVRVIKIAGLTKIYLPEEETDEERKAKSDKEIKEQAEKLKKEAEKKKKEEPKVKEKPETKESRPEKQVAAVKEEKPSEEKKEEKPKEEEKKK